MNTSHRHRSGDANTVGRPADRAGSRSGTAATELAVSLPLLAILVFGSMEMANAVFMRQSLNMAAYEAAKVITRPNGGNEPLARARCGEVLAIRGISDYTLTFSPTVTAATPRGTQATAVNVFLDEAQMFPYPPRTSVVTWSNTFSTDVPLPASAGFSWTTNRTAVTNAVNYRTTNGVGGTTWLSNGLDMAVQSLSGSNHKPLSTRVVILLTDGQWNGGRDPVLAAQDAAAAGIIVHTVSMATALQPVLGQVASITGGVYYPTFTSAELSQAFRDIARSLPVVLID